MFASGGAAVAAKKAPAAAPTGKMKAAASEKVDVLDSKDEAVKTPTKSEVDRPRLPAAMEAPPKPPKVLPSSLDDTDVARRAIEGLTVRRSYAADATDGGTLLMSAPRRERGICAGGVEQR